MAASQNKQEKDSFDDANKAKALRRNGIWSRANGPILSTLRTIRNTIRCSRAMC
jgi:hypothetical protein